MKISSPAFKNNEEIPAEYTCDGKNISPQLNFAGVPDTTESLALIVSDSDAPGGEWVHWLVWNIDPKTVLVAENSIPKGGIEGQTSFMCSDGPLVGYGGPCPPNGTHHYQFKLYALTEKLESNIEMNKTQLTEAMSGKIIAEDTLVGLYSKE